jgi:hypothetical protein
MLCDPPWFVLAIETFNLELLSLPIMGDLDRRNIRLQPGQECWVNLRADILSGWVFGGRPGFVFEFGLPGRIKFEEETLGIFQRCRIWSRQGVILLTERVDRAQKIEWGFRVSYTPDTTFRRSLRSVNWDCEQHREAEQNEDSPTAGLPLEKQEHFQHLAQKLAQSTITNWSSPRRLRESPFEISPFSWYAA